MWAEERSRGTEWKFRYFSATQIFHEINFNKSKKSKNASFKSNLGPKIDKFDFT